MTTRVFLYGSLLDDACRAVVLGRETAGEAAVLPGRRVVWDGNFLFPVLIEGDGVEGILVEASEAELERLDYFESDYSRHAADVRAGDGVVRAAVYDGGAAPEASGRAWALDDCAARWAVAAREAAREVMALYEAGVPAGEMDGIWPRTLSRGWARSLGDGASPSERRKGAGRDGVTLEARESLHRGFFGLDRATLSHATFAGGSERIVRECFIGADAALVLPYDPATDRIVLIEQFRVGPFLRGDRQPWQFEPVAGIIDPGESPESTARREAVEEAGITLGRLIPGPKGYAAPGNTTEHFHLFVGICDLEGYTARTAGLDHEAEDILTHPMPLDEALGLIETGEVAVVPLIALLLWTAAHRGRLAGR